MGKYEVKISSIELDGENAALSDMNFLPMIELLAPFAQSHFFLHKSSLSSYRPEDDIRDYYIPDYKKKTLLIKV